MHPWDFDRLESVGDLSSDPANVWASSPYPQLDTDLLDEIALGPIPERCDLEVAVALARRAHDEFESRATDGTSVTNEGSRLLLRALRAVLDRLGVAADVFAPPFRDFATWERHWRSQRATGEGSWQRRRDILDGVFEPTHKLLNERDSAVLSTALATGISPRGSTGWGRVDEELNEMRRHFQSAATEQDYSNVGNDAVAVLEALSAAAYDHARHGGDGPEPAVSETKNRLDAVVAVELVGPAQAELRKVVKAAIELAQATKHRRRSGDRRSAGITADSVLLVVHLVRRLREPT